MSIRRAATGNISRVLLAIALSIVAPAIALCGFDEGVASYRVGNYPDAFRQWTEAAQQGDADAQYNLGCLYVRGEGVSPDRGRAAEWFQRAAAQGEIDATTWLFFATPQTEESRKEYFAKRLEPSDRFHLTFVAQRSDGQAMRWTCSTDDKDGAAIQFKIGLMYDNGGMGLPQDDTQAAAWYRRASERNVADAQTRLAYLYAAGRGVEKNLIEAARLFRKAAEQGNTDAQVNLGFIYATGSYGIVRDPILGYALVSHAAETGKKLALDSLAELKAHLTPDQMREGQSLADKWKGTGPWPSEIARRMGPPK